MNLLRPQLVHVALGSNEGDRDAHLQRAVDRLAQTPGIAVRRVSSALETAFVGDGPAQGPYRNAVVEIECALPPHALFALCKQLEAEAGRKLPAPRNQPRPLDLDIVFYGDEVVDTRDLVVPHPRWHERAFVLEPLAELGVDVRGKRRWEGPEVIEAPAAMSADRKAHV